MYITFKSNKLKRNCETFDAGRPEWGDAIARKVVDRIRVLKAAYSMEDLGSLPPLRCHPLKGDRKGQYAMDLVHPFRFIFELIDKERLIEGDPGGQLEKGVRILGVEDYH